MTSQLKFKETQEEFEARLLVLPREDDDLYKEPYSTPSSPAYIPASPFDEYADDDDEYYANSVLAAAAADDDETPLAPATPTASDTPFCGDEVVPDTPNTFWAYINRCVTYSSPVVEATEKRKYPVETAPNTKSYHSSDDEDDDDDVADEDDETETFACKYPVEKAPYTLSYYSSDDEDDDDDDAEPSTKRRRYTPTSPIYTPTSP